MDNDEDLEIKNKKLNLKELSIDDLWKYKLELIDEVEKIEQLIKTKKEISIDAEKLFKK
tara:strand:- start:81 stop:257 length:177 start_codon:yes stop_codon:yes gene_type:complete